MTTYIVRRIGEGLVTLIALSFVVFGSVHLTGDPARFLLPISAEHDESVYEAQKAAYGLDKPFIVQYWNFLIKAVRLDFGDSFTARRPVQEILLERIPATVHLAIAGTILAIGIGVPLGIISAVKRDTFLDRICKAFAIFGMAAPQFWVAIMLIIVFAGYWGLLPAFGRGDVTGWFPTWSQIPNMLLHLILPAFVLALAIIAAIMRLARSAMLEVLDSDYVKFAQVKGMSDRVVIWKHAARNALIPVITFGGISLAGLLNGSVVVEVVFAWPGVGLMLLEGVLSNNFPQVEGAIMVSGAAYILTALVVDILYGYADPRVRMN
ncbi:MAG: ABC transporter permease [Chloroflexota bacterium]|nr:ABC transporter permease [Chloroflexota bacterium]MDE2959905.1 ABC transporter permease [Chloroflexota bacterium]